MAIDVIDYTPPPTIKEFIKDYRPGELFYDWVIGPYGSGKTTGLFFKLCHLAKMQTPSLDGVRRTRAVVVRNTMPQLKDTTLVSWNYWFREPVAGKWNATDKIFLLKFGDVECEVLFRPLDTEDDVARVLSLEVTFVIIDEFVQIPRKIIEALAGRCGRFPSKKDGGATNWGMWGSSNPDTEDNWWFEYLHQGLPASAKYFVQPSGFSEYAENCENLPGKRAYYTQQAEGKSESWVKQFLCAEWGFSISGKPVVSTFKPSLHLAKTPLRYNSLLPLVVGFDPGLAGSAMIFGQETLYGRLNVLGELVQSGYGAERLITERMRPYLRQRFPNAEIIIVPDPAAANRTQTDEKTVVDKFKNPRYGFKVVIESNNRLPLRLDAIEHYATRLVEGEPALQIDAVECPTLVRALKGGWRWAIDAKRDTVKSAEPEKNAYSHPGDGFGYLCRYFHKLAERGSRYGKSTPLFVPPRQFGPSYHIR